MKRLLFILLCAFFVATYYPQPITADFFADNAVILFTESNLALINNRETQIDEDTRIMPVVENARTLVPVRFIAEGFGMDVDYNEHLCLVTITGNEASVCYILGSNTVSVNGIEKLIDPENPNVIAKTINDRTFIPLRSFAEAIGKEVFYHNGLIVISDSASSINADKDKQLLDNIIAKINVLPAVGSAENLRRMLNTDNYDRENITAEKIMGEAPPSLDDGIQFAAPENLKMTESYARAAHSDTNIQVAGVDEADIVKTDGNYLYHVSSQKIIITKINPVSEMSVASVIKRTDEEFYPREIFIDGGKLVIIAHVNKLGQPQVYDSAKKIQIAPQYPRSALTQVTVYNITDRENPVLERTLEIEGNYISSRKIDNIVYMVSTKYPSRYYPTEDFPIIYHDNGTACKQGYDSIRYFPGFASPNFLVISSIDITQPDKEAVVQTLLGSGENIYVSKDNLYVASSEYDAEGAKTAIYKFSLANGSITYLKKARVEGNILNQFSMDEYNGYFRIATTTWKNQQENNLYILDDTLTQCGSIEEIAPGERIYSVRFVGNRGYMVTFRQVDPLFVIDLADPYKPEILGNLKIPGYSDYIHPVDENHIIGFGKDATGEGLYQGMKMALFDVSDVTKPVQKFREIIGDRGTESALLQNHKALLYAPEHNLLAFPITVREVYEKDQYNSAYGQLTFSGAYVYNFDTGHGFSLRGKISHLTNEEMLKLGDYVQSDKEIRRILYSGDSLITVSDSRVQAHTIDDVKYQNGIEIIE